MPSDSSLMTALARPADGPEQRRRARVRSLGLYVLDGRSIVPKQGGLARRRNCSVMEKKRRMKKGSGRAERVRTSSCQRSGRFGGVGFISGA